MSLPKSLTQIFDRKQKSYKMVLILSLIEEMRVSSQVRVSFENVKERFHNYYIREQEKGNLVDEPSGKGIWRNVPNSQLKDIINSPIHALSDVLFLNPEDQSIGFHNKIYSQLGEEELLQLDTLANEELQSYNLTLTSFSLQSYLERIMEEYVSSKKEGFKEHPLGKLFRQVLPLKFKALPFIDEQYKVNGSVGQGNWATIPWIAFLDKRITETTQTGEYIVYLFAEDMSAVYLTFNQGVTVPLKEKGRMEGYAYLQDRVKEIRNLIPLSHMNRDGNIHLVDSGLGQDYQVSTVAYIKYDRGNIPNDEKLIHDLEKVMEDYRLYVDIVTSKDNKLNERRMEKVILEAAPMQDEEVKVVLNQIQSYIHQKGFFFPNHLIENFYLSLKTKPFVILAGISGTGKTRLVKLFAEALGATKENRQYTLIPVRPDWSDPSDLVGYKDLTGKFKPGPLTDILVEAKRSENQNKPYFICLDEMNLARVEHYFSDLLSVLETQEWVEEKISTQDIISSSNLDTTEDQIKYSNLSIPENVFLIGTVNMDETTYPFSKKVLDRANTIEFNNIDLNQFPDLAEHELTGDSDEINGVVLEHQNNHFLLRSDYLQLIDAYEMHKDLVVRTTDRLVEINALLEDAHANVGFRVRDAICFYMIYNERFKLMSEEEAFDHQLMQKILPRIQGSNSSVRRVLLDLMKVTLGNSSGVTLNIKELMDNDASELYSKWERGKTPPNSKYPQSARKLAFMLRRLDEDGFTSYWLS